MDRIEIKDISGMPVMRVSTTSDAGARQSWSAILREIAHHSERGLKGLDFTGLIKEQVNVQNLIIEDCHLDLDEMQRSIFLNCEFKNVTMTQSSFHHVGDRSDKSDRSLGALFKGCTFTRCKMIKCDFVMSKFYECEFDQCYIDRCDMRNVFWYDRPPGGAQIWSDLPKMPDPFKTSTLKSSTFGHPVSNIMNLPMQMMIPKSYETVWHHMGPVQRKLTRLSYLMSEEKKEIFSSSV